MFNNRQPWIIASMCVGFAGYLFADDGVSPETPRPSPPPVIDASIKNGVLASDGSFSNSVARWHKSWSSNVVSAADRIDRFFSVPRIEEEGNDTRIKLSLGVRLKEREPIKFIHRLNLRLSLPHTSDRIQLVIEDLVESEDPANANEIFNDVGASDPDTSIRYQIKRQERVKLDADVGARLGREPQVFLRLRGSRTYELAHKWQLRLTQRVLWFTRDGWVLNSESQVNKHMGWDWLFRSTSLVEWREDREGYRPAQVFSVFKTFSRRRALRLDVGGSWPEMPYPEERIYFATLSHRRLLHSNWMYIEFKSGVEFPEEYDYATVGLVSFQIDMIFGNVD